MRYWSTFFKCANYDVNFVLINQLLKKKKKNLCPGSLKMPSHESWNIRCAKATVCQSWALRAGIINASQEDSASASVGEVSCSSTALKATYGIASVGQSLTRQSNKGLFRLWLEQGMGHLHGLFIIAVTSQCAWSCVRRMCVVHCQILSLQSWNEHRPRPFSEHLECPALLLRTKLST